MKPSTVDLSSPPIRSTDRSIAVWNIRNTSACIEMYELRFDKAIGSFCFTRTSAELLVSTDGHLRLHNALDGNVLQVMEQQCQSVFVGQLGGDMLTVGRDAVVRIWNVGLGEECHHRLTADIAIFV
jgi:WD40 repeat protein